MRIQRAREEIRVFAKATAISIDAAAQPARTPPEEAEAPRIEIEAKLVEIPGDQAGGGSAWGTVLSEEDYKRVIASFEKRRDLDVLSSPRLTTRSGQRAVVEVIREFRHPDKFSNEEAERGQVVPSHFVTRSVGFTLEVLPTAGSDGWIDIALTSTLLKFVGFINLMADLPSRAVPGEDPVAGMLASYVKTDQVLNQPVFQIRSFQSSVSMRSGETTVLGGMARWDEAGRTDPKPERMFDSLLFADLPTNKTRGTRRELLVYLTAREIEFTRPPGAALRPDGPVTIGTTVISVPWRELRDRPKPAPPGVFAISEVLPPGKAAERFQDVARSATFEGEEETVAKGEHYLARIDDRVGGESATLTVDVQPTVTKTGEIDLVIIPAIGDLASRDDGAAAPPRIRTSVGASGKSRQEDGSRTAETGASVRNGQTVVLKGADPLREGNALLLLIKTGDAATAPSPQFQKSPAERSKVPAGDTPYGKAVPGKPGFAFSPHTSEDVYIDVRGFDPGTPVRCPFSGRMFRVPYPADVPTD